MERIRVAIIDDEEMVCRIFEEYLRPLGYEVRSAYDTESGFELCKSFKPHFLFLDVVLPDESGITLIKRLRPLELNILIIMISGLHDLTIAKAAIKAGAVDYIPKPIDLEFVKNFIACQI